MSRQWRFILVDVPALDRATEADGKLARVHGEPAGHIGRRDLRLILAADDDHLVADRSAGDISQVDAGVLQRGPHEDRRAATAH